MTIEAMKMALEVLEELNETNSYWWQEVDEETVGKIDPAITALRKAIQEEALRNVQRLGQEIEQEPVAWMYVNKDGECEQIEYGEAIDDPSVTLLYDHPQPKRKPLTDEQIINEADKFDWDKDCAVRFARAIEAAHGIKGEE